MHDSSAGLRHVIIGNGVAGTICAETLRKLDPLSDVTLIGGEPYPLYNRVALPPFLKGKALEKKVIMRSRDDHANKGIKLHLETWVTRVCAQDKVVYTDGAAFPYDRLLVATGGRPRLPDLPGVAGTSGVFNFQTLDDTKAIIAQAEQVTSAVVFGGSYIAYELAEALSERGLNVTWIMRGPRLLHRILDVEGGAVVDAIARQHGVNMLYNDRVAEVQSRDGKIVGVTTVSGKQIETGMLCCGLGFDYNTEILEGTGIHLNQAIIADEYLRTAVPNIFAAGDVAEAKNLMTGEHEVMGTWDSATTHGRLAARNMLGENVPFDDPSVYTSTMFHTKMRAVGRVPHHTDANYSSISQTDIAKQTHFKLLFEKDVLVGAIAVGNMPRRAELLHLIRSHEPVTDKHRLLAPEEKRTAAAQPDAE
ncbi:MAG: FAD-dependent pyridine nucleotide-disulfide oxidoreductase [Chloroflexi bacterium]|jgi:NADPH-dependent 2,4-dienoyl-CoA reductase/sulfur reductase-like enzyme|nr:FAD-dependent pyridine nucleotide-disulfide oxidoreductase [Chloroflexota bacterium]